VYVSKRQLTASEQTTFATAKQRYPNMSEQALIADMIRFGAIAPQAKPLGVAQSGGSVSAASLRAGTTGTPTPHAQAIDMTAASRVMSQGIVAGRNDPAATEKRGKLGLSAVYTAQGYHAKPDVLTKEQIDGYVKAGERELFRGTYGSDTNPDAHNELFRSGAVHYAGTGMYGHGTYTGDFNTSQAYAGGRQFGTIIRMTLKADAKVGVYGALDAQRQQEYDLATNSPRYARYDAAELDLRRQRSKVALLPKTRSANVQAARDAQIADFDRRIERVLARRDREIPTRIYDDVGAYAAAKGYDAYTVQGTGQIGGTNYHVILNRGAVRVQDTSITPP
jgi:hypothetical protein